VRTQESDVADVGRVKRAGFLQGDGAVTAGFVRQEDFEVNIRSRKVRSDVDWRAPSTENTEEIAQRDVATHEVRAWVRQHEDELSQVATANADHDRRKPKQLVAIISFDHKLPEVALLDLESPGTANAGQGGPASRITVVKVPIIIDDKRDGFGIGLTS